MASIAEASSLFEIDMELDGLMEEIELQIESEGEPSEELTARFQEFCEARGEKVDRIGRFVRMMEAREQFCRSEAARLGDRARAAANKIERTKNMALYYLLSRDLKKIEGREFTLRAQKNSVSVLTFPLAPEDHASILLDDQLEMFDLLRVRAQLHMLLDGLVVLGDHQRRQRFGIERIQIGQRGRKHGCSIPSARSKCSSGKRRMNTGESP